MGFHERLRGQASTRLQSIASNLQAVLNAKEGYAASVEVFGLGRYDGHYGNQELLETLVEEMLAKVSAYEPRLRDPSIALVGRDPMLWVRFLLTGVCDGLPCSFTISFHSVFRHVKVVPG